MKFYGIVLAGGSGSRVGSELPKQLLELAGRPVLSYCLQAFFDWRRTEGLVVVMRSDLRSQAREMLEAGRIRSGREKLPVEVVAGGETRHASTINGLRTVEQFATDEDVVFLHDAARPFIEQDELERLAGCFLNDDGCAVASLAAPVTDTIVSGDGLPGTMTERLDRNRLFAVKTPQALRMRALSILFRLPESPEFTDLLSWGERGGLPGRLVPAGANNHKLTTAADIPFLEGLLK